MSKPLLLVTGGDPCGVGPEVILKALARPVRPTVRIAVIGDLAIFEQTAKRLKLPLPRWRVTASPPRPLAPSPVRRLAHSPSRPFAVSEPELFEHGRRVLFLNLAHPWRFTPGQSSARAGLASLEYLDAAITLLRRGLGDGLVTAPVTKWAIKRAYGSFEGQTEYLASAFRTPDVVMMFVSEPLRVALLTRHLALRDVPSRVTRQLLRRTIQLTNEGLQRDFRIRQPRLAVCGLNPHAGEAGLFGDEERRVLLPVLHDCQRHGIRVAGPFAADGFFATRQRYDAMICWYHDQGLIPFKLLARDQGCQLSVGLPIVRTSPDHGSALDIAGQGRAHPGSMRYALALAAKLVFARGVKKGEEG